MAMMHTTVSVPADLTELLSDHSMTLEELARACRMAPDWVSARVHEGVLSITQISGDPRVMVDDLGTWRFSCTTAIRARRLADLQFVEGDVLDHVGLVQGIGGGRRHQQHGRGPEKT